MSYGMDDFGRDDDIKCDCGGKTYLTYEQGRGLNSYECEECGDHFQVQFDWDDDEADDEYCYDYNYADFTT
jgi:DNA-directed RNA polymerase subunit RPC12/RpoP